MVSPDYTDIIQFVFENGDKMPEGFYVQLMDLLKKIYFNEHGENVEKIHELLESNRNIVDKNILRVLNRSFKKKRVCFNCISFNYLCFNCISFNYFCFRYQCIFNFIVIILFIGFGFGITWTITHR